LRGLEPRFAIRNLARAHLLAAGIVAIGLDHRFWSALPSLAPLRPLSPSIGVIETVVMAVGERVAGRHEHARRAYGEVLERTSQPDLAGLDASNHRFLRFGVMYGLAAIEAGMGLPTSLEWAQQLGTEPLHEVNALHVRVLYELWQGRAYEADKMRELIELRRIESTSPQMADGTHLIWQAVAHACSDDLTHLKQALDELRRLAQRHAGWQSVVYYALGECDRIRGNLSGALEHFQAVLTEWHAGTHQIWPYAAGAHVSVLAALGQAQQACEAGASYLRAAEEADLGYLCNYIRMPLAIALSRCGEHEPAKQLANSSLSGYRELGATGLNLLLAYDACARVALATGDRSEFDSVIALYEDCCQASQSQLMRAKYDRLVWLARVDSLTTPDTDGFAVSTLLADTRIASTFSENVQSSVRVERSLQMLLAASGASQGALYLNRESGLQLAAATGEDERLLHLATMIRGFVESELQDGNTATATLFDLRAPGPATGIEGCDLVLLSHHVTSGFVITGVAALVCQSNATFIHPGALAARLSGLLADLRDAVALRST
jgi:hypothetical protein